MSSCNNKPILTYRCTVTGYILSNNQMLLLSLNFAPPSLKSNQFPQLCMRTMTNFIYNYRYLGLFIFTYFVCFYVYRYICVIAPF